MLVVIDWKQARIETRERRVDLIEIIDSDVPEYKVEDDKVVVDNMENLFKTIYNYVFKNIYY